MDPGLSRCQTQATQSAPSCAALGPFFLLLFTGTAAAVQTPQSQALAQITEDQADAEQRVATPTLRVGDLPEETLRLDGVLSEPMWAAADSIDNLTTVEPEEGSVPPARTTVTVLANSNDIVVGVRCRDPNVAGIVSFSNARDVELENEDPAAAV